MPSGRRFSEPTWAERWKLTFSKGAQRMQLGMIGLGRMGGNMVRRLVRGGHACVVYGRSPESVGELIKDGAAGTTDLRRFVAMVEKPGAGWLKVPAAGVGGVLGGRLAVLAPGGL